MQVGEDELQLRWPCLESCESEGEVVVGPGPVLGDQQWLLSMVSKQLLKICQMLEPSDNINTGVLSYSDQY